MFRTLKYVVEFSNGRTLKQDVEFDKGMTAIYGTNESGKSFLLEMLRFALFGSSALRGIGEDYVRLEMAASFDIRGETYKVERTLKKATLSRGVEVIATGVSPVNEKFYRLLGFGLSVFDVACAANQDDLLSLTSMRPTERKKLVDSVVGIGALDVVAKWAKDEALAIEREVKAQMNVLVRPTEPLVPENYEPSAAVQERLHTADIARETLAALDGWLSSSMAQPVAPKCTVQIPSENLRKFANERIATRTRLAECEARLRTLPEACDVTQEQVDLLRVRVKDYDTWNAARLQLEADPRPSLTRAEADRNQQQWAEFNAYGLQETKRKRLADRLAALEADMLTCPSCEHSWHTDPSVAEGLRQEIAALDLKPVEEPEDAMIVGRAALSFYARWKEEDYKALEDVPRVENPGLTLTALDALEHRIKLFAERPAVEQEIAQLKQRMNGPDFESQLNTRLAYESQLETYVAARTTFENWQKERQLKVQRRAEVSDVAGTYPGLRILHDTMRNYERDLDRYNAEEVKYLEAIDRVVLQEKQADQYRKVQEAMLLFRQKVKQYLLPSLNRVASQLLSKMTGGSRTSVMVDDDFNILADGQRVETLSGSGKACVNLALRIALGQVLVNNTFSVFLGDEIDGSMDKNRAAETTLTLRNLAKSVSQVLVISHKAIEADQDIILGETYADEPNSGSL